MQNFLKKHKCLVRTQQCHITNTQNENIGKDPMLKDSKENQWKKKELKAAVPKKCS